MGRKSRRSVNTTSGRKPNKSVAMLKQKQKNKRNKVSKRQSFFKVNNLETIEPAGKLIYQEKIKMNSNFQDDKMLEEVAFVNLSGTFSNLPMHLKHLTTTQKVITDAKVTLPASFDDKKMLHAVCYVDLSKVNDTNPKRKRSVRFSGVTTITNRSGSLRSPMSADFTVKSIMKKRKIEDTEDVIEMDNVNDSAVNLGRRVRSRRDSVSLIQDIIPQSTPVKTKAAKKLIPEDIIRQAESMNEHEEACDNEDQETEVKIKENQKPPPLKKKKLVWPFKMRLAKTFDYNKHVCEGCNTIYPTNVDLQLHLLRHIQPTFLRVEVVNYDLSNYYNLEDDEIDLKTDANKSKSKLNVSVQEMKELVEKYSKEAGSLIESDGQDEEDEDCDSDKSLKETITTDNNSDSEAPNIAELVNTQTSGAQAVKSNFDDSDEKPSSEVEEKNEFTRKLKAPSNKRKNDSTSEDDSKINSDDEKEPHTGNDSDEHEDEEKITKRTVRTRTPNSKTKLANSSPDKRIQRTTNEDDNKSPSKKINRTNSRKSQEKGTEEVSCLELQNVRKSPRKSAQIESPKSREKGKRLNSDEDDSINKKTRFEEKENKNEVAENESESLHENDKSVRKKKNKKITLPDDKTVLKGSRSKNLQAEEISEGHQLEDETSEPVEQDNENESDVNKKENKSESIGDNNIKNDPKNVKSPETTDPQIDESVHLNLQDEDDEECESDDVNGKTEEISNSEEDLKKKSKSKRSSKVSVKNKSSSEEESGYNSREEACSKKKQNSTHIIEECENQNNDIKQNKETTDNNLSESEEESSQDTLKEKENSSVKETTKDIDLIDIHSDSDEDQGTRDSNGDKNSNVTNNEKEENCGINHNDDIEDTEDEEGSVDACNNQDCESQHDEEEIETRKKEDKAKIDDEGKMIEDNSDCDSSIKDGQEQENMTENDETQSDVSKFDKEDEHIKSNNKENATIDQDCSDKDGDNEDTAYIINNEDKIEAEEMTKDDQEKEAKTVVNENNRCNYEKLDKKEAKLVSNLDEDISNNKDNDVDTYVVGDDDDDDNDNESVSKLSKNEKNDIEIITSDDDDDDEEEGRKSSKNEKDDVENIISDDDDVEEITTSNNEEEEVVSLIEDEETNMNKEDDVEEIMSAVDEDVNEEKPSDDIEDEETNEAECTVERITEEQSRNDKMDNVLQKIENDLEELCLPKNPTVQKNKSDSSMTNEDLINILGVDDDDDDDVDAGKHNEPDSPKNLKNCDGKLMNTQKPVLVD